jgi:hypothetical protein
MKTTPSILPLVPLLVLLAALWIGAFVAMLL